MRARCRRRIRTQAKRRHSQPQTQTLAAKKSKRNNDRSAHSVCNQLQLRSARVGYAIGRLAKFPTTKRSEAAVIRHSTRLGLARSANPSLNAKLVELPQAPALKSLEAPPSPETFPWETLLKVAERCHLPGSRQQMPRTAVIERFRTHFPPQEPPSPASETPVSAAASRNATDLPADAPSEALCDTRDDGAKTLRGRYG